MKHDDNVFRFTPLMLDGTRSTMTVSRSDKAQIFRGRRWFGVVTDLNTGRHYEVEGAECSLPGCYCDARVLTEISSRKPSADYERRRLQTQLLGVGEKIIAAQQYVASLAEFPAVRSTNGIEEDLTDSVREVTHRHIQELEAETERVKQEIDSLSDF